MLRQDDKPNVSLPCCGHITVQSEACNVTPHVQRLLARGESVQVGAGGLSKSLDTQQALVVMILHGGICVMCQQRWLPL